MSDTCKWNLNESDDYWEASCGYTHQFNHEGPKENNFNFCPNCGLPLEVEKQEKNP